MRTRNLIFKDETEAKLDATAHVKVQKSTK